MGARTAPPPCARHSNIVSYLIRTRHFFILVLCLHALIISSTASESDILLKLKDSLSNTEPLANWKPSTNPCNGDTEKWTGVLCSKGTVYGLQLENMGLGGIIDIDSLSKLPNIRTLSFMNNNFEGAIPDLKKLGALKSIYLSNNRFSGEIPENGFERMLSLKKVLLAQNQFTGEIPKSLAKLSKLIELRLEGNQFEGEIPEFRFGKNMKTFNVSNNSLSGPIPASLLKLDSTSFQGNKGLCGAPLGDECKPSTPPSPSPNQSSKKISPLRTIIIICIAIITVFTIIALVSCLITKPNKHKSSSISPTPNMTILPMNPEPKGISVNLHQMEQGSNFSRMDKSGSTRKEQGVKLSFIRDDRERFDLQDLLKASAEILGGGVFGSSYKANLVSGVMIVVKRFRHMNNVGKEEFQEHMRRIGRLRHPNLIPLVAYYYKKEEKLLVWDYVQRGSLALHLHGNKSRGKPSPDWPTRLKIVKGVAKGLAYLYNELPSLITPHGHLKSSNVLLNESFEPVLTDYGLVPVMNQEHAQEVMVAYKSPEYSKHGRITKKTDVWSFGILILEILTGRFPASFLQKGKASDESDLVGWVNSVANEEGVFDKEMEGTKNSEGEMVKLLKIGLACCEIDIEKRLDLKLAIEKIEELRDFDDEFYSSYASEGDINSSRGVSYDFDYTTNG